MTLDELISELGSLPTMMTADQELNVIRKLAAVSDDLILQDLPRFFPLLWDLYDSHTGAGIFEVDDSNVDEFGEFARRLRHLAARVESSDDAERLRNAADAFSTRFSM